MELQPEVIIINKLKPLASKLVSRTVMQYQSSIYSTIFNKEELSALAEDLILEIANKIINKQVDEKGMYNYFKKSFNYKCQDKYKAHAHTQKRGHINIENNDISEFQLNTLKSTGPENIINIKNELTDILNFLQKFDTTKVNHSKLFECMLGGYSVDEMRDILKISASTVERHKLKTIGLIKQYVSQNKEVSDFIDPTENENLLYYMNHDKYEEEIIATIFKEIKPVDDTKHFNINLQLIYKKSGKECLNKILCLESNITRNEAEYNYFINQDITSYVIKYRQEIEEAKIEFNPFT
jgi:hypothetical protein